MWRKSRARGGHGGAQYGYSNKLSTIEWKEKLETRKAVSLQRVNGGRKDQGCGSEMNWHDSEQLSCSPGDKNEIEETEEVGSTGVWEKTTTEEQKNGGELRIWILGVSPEGRLLAYHSSLERKRR